LLIVALVIIAALSLTGYALTPPAKARRRVPLSLSVGTLVVGWSMWIAGRLIGTTAAFVVAALLFLFSLRRIRECARDCRRVARELGALVRASPFTSALLLLPFVIAVPQLLTPLVDSDGLRYHAAFAKLFLLQGRVTDYPWDVNGFFPQTAEMIFMLHVESAKLIHFGFFIAMLATLMLVVHRRRRDRTVAVVAPFLLAASPVILAPAAAAFIDHIALFHIAVAFLVLQPALPLAAAFATKYVTAPAIAVLGLRRRGLLVTIAAIAIAFAPFAIRNALRAGDPIFPIGHVLLHKPVEGLAPGGVARATQWHAGMGGIVAIPWMPSPDAQPDEVAGLHHLLGLFALLVAVKERRLRRAAAMVIVYLALGAVMRVSVRFMFPMLFALVLLESFALTRLPKKLIGIVALVVCAPALLWSAECLFTFANPFLYLRGRLDRKHYLAAFVPGYRVTQAVNVMPPGGQVMALDFPAPYYFDRPWVAEGILNEPPLKLWLHEARDAGEIVRKLHGLDVRVLVVTPGYGGASAASLLPLASSPREAQIIAALRSQLRLRAVVDGCAIFDVP